MDFRRKEMPETRVWGCVSVMPATGRLRQECVKFQGSLDYTERLSQKGGGRKAG